LAPLNLFISQELGKIWLTKKYRLRTIGEINKIFVFWKSKLNWTWIVWMNSYRWVIQAQVSL
jgi:hypothetical protein